MDATIIHNQCAYSIMMIQYDKHMYDMFYVCICICTSLIIYMCKIYNRHQKAILIHLCSATGESNRHQQWRKDIKRRLASVRSHRHLPSRGMTCYATGRVSQSAAFPRESTGRPLLFNTKLISNIHLSIYYM